MKLLTILFIFLFAIGCTQTGQGVFVESTDDKSWDKPVSIWYSNNDTSVIKNISLMLRYNDCLDSDTVLIAIGVVSPDKKIFRDTLSFKIQKAITKAGFRVEEYCTPIFSDVRFLETGAYCFSFYPLNNPPIKGIVGVGVIF